MMDYRENAGYIITDSCHVGDSEFVLGVHLTAPQQFVTWKCSNRTDYDSKTAFLPSTSAWGWMAGSTAATSTLWWWAAVVREKVGSTPK